MLLLKGSMAAAELNQAADVRDLQREALSVAGRLDGEHNEHWSAFGLTNVRIHEVSALADMHSGGLVVEAANQIPYDALMRLPRERRASHLLDKTRGYLQWGKRDEAASALLDADQLAPEEVRCRRMTRQIVSELIHSYPRGSRPTGAIVTLARALGVPA